MTVQKHQASQLICYEMRYFFVNEIQIREIADGGRKNATERTLSGLIRRDGATAVTLCSR
jgi:hypothetical protein